MAITYSGNAEGVSAYGHFHIKLEVQKMQFLGLISSQNKICCSILHLHSTNGENLMRIGPVLFA